MIYFDNAATGGRKPDCVLTALASAVKVCANPGRSGHKLSLACATAVQSCRRELNEYFDGYGIDRVAFTKNCSEALNVALLGVLEKGDHVVASCMEHNSVLRPLEFLKKTNVITYDVLGLDENGTLDYARLPTLLRKNTKLVAITSASNVTGTMPDLALVRSLLPKNVLLLCDGAQGAGHFDIKMRGGGIDLLTLAGHKGLFASQGVGALLFSERVSPKPLLFGGTGSISLSLDMPDFYPDRLECGTLPYPAILSLLEGVRYLTTHQADIKNRIESLTKYLLDGLYTLPRYQIYSKINPCGIVALAHHELQSELIADRLSNEYDIAVRGGLHCAPLMHEGLSTQENGLVRISLSHYNKEWEIDELLRALSEIK